MGSGWVQWGRLVWMMMMGEYEMMFVLRRSGRRSDEGRVGSGFLPLFFFFKGFGSTLKARESQARFVILPS